MDETPPIRVLIADDHAGVRHSLRTFLEAHDDLAVIGEAEDGLEALQLCEQYLPDVILLDLAMPHLNGLQATPLIRAQYPKVQVIVLSASLEAETGDAAREAGAFRVLSKQVRGEVLVQAIREAYHASHPDE